MGAPRLVDGGQLRDEAAAYVRELISSGQVVPGDRLRVKEIADAVGTSITPVREALLVLLQEGSVAQEANRGFRVAAISRRDITDAYMVHGFAAGELAARAATAADDELLAELRYLDAAIRNACQLMLEDGAEMRRRVEELNYQLHGAIYTRAASPRLWSFVDQASHFGPRRFWVTIPGWIELNRDGHQPIIEALAARDPEGSRAAMRAHLEDAEALLVAHLDSLGLWADGSADGKLPDEAPAAGARRPLAGGKHAPGGALPPVAQPTGRVA